MSKGVELLQKLKRVSELAVIHGLELCVNWTWANDGNGYGVLVVDGVRHRAHRVTLEFALGRPLRQGMVACHHCDNPSCVNPLHLYEGTQSDNSRDRAVSCRAHKPQPEPREQVDDEAVRWVKRFLKLGIFDNEEIARRCGVKPFTVYEIQHNWRHFKYVV